MCIVDLYTYIFKVYVNGIMCYISFCFLLFLTLEHVPVWHVTQAVSPYYVYVPHCPSNGHSGCLPLPIEMCCDEHLYK